MEYLLALLAAAAVLVLASTRRVRPDERLVVVRPGRPARTAGPGITWVIPLLDSTQRVGTEPRERWAVAKATTIDGVTARVQVEFSVRVVEPEVAPRDVDQQVVDAVEDALRHEIGRRTVADLPTAGDDPAWAPEAFLPGVLVEHAVVISSDVVVTSELRRLVGTRPAQQTWS